MSKIVIVGGTSGMGLSIAKKLIKDGEEVIVAGRSKAKLDTVLAELGQMAKGYEVDASDAKQLAKVYSAIGSFDHLVLSLSGAKGGGQFATLNLDELYEGFEAKFWAQIKALQTALPYLSGGSITFITAVSAQMANPGTAGLAAINGALERMIPVLAVELAPIRINGISPGVVDTPWWDWMPLEQRKDAFKQFANASLVGRIGTPEDIALAAQVLIKNTFITGQTLVVDGGLKTKFGG